MEGATIKAKEFLKQVQKIDRLIDNKIAERNQWISKATSTVASSSGERVQTSGNPYKMENAIINYLGLTEEIDKIIAELAAKKADVIKMIELLPPIEYDVLHKIYIQYKTLQDVADDYDKTYSWATTIQGRAMQHLQKYLNEREGRKSNEGNQ